jgi:hypothetical protein
LYINSPFVEASSVRKVSQFYSPYGELYSKAVIFGLCPSDFAFGGSGANKISLKPKGFNITYYSYL